LFRESILMWNKSKKYFVFKLFINVFIFENKKLKIKNKNFKRKGRYIQRIY